MLLHINALKVVSITTNEKDRYDLDSLQISPDGSTVATDGRRLAKYVPPADIEEELTYQRARDTFPELKGLDARAPLATPVVVEAAIVRDILAAHKKAQKALPKYHGFDWAEYLAVDAVSEPGVVILAVTDMKNPTVLRSKTVTNFPPVDQIMAGTESYPFTIAFRAQYLRDIADLAIKMTGGDRTQMLCLHVKDGKTRAVFRTAMTSHGNLFALIMPLKTPEQLAEEQDEHEAHWENDRRNRDAEYARREAELAAQDAAADAVAA